MQFKWGAVNRVGRAFDGYLNRLKVPTSYIQTSYRSYAEADIPVLLDQWVTSVSKRHWPRWLYDDACDEILAKAPVITRSEEMAVLNRLMNNTHDALDSDDDEPVSLPDDPCIRISLLRLRFGELVEEDLNMRWSCEKDEARRLQYATISLAAAVWTSTHAELLLARSTEHSYLHRATIHLIPSEYTDPQLSEFVTSTTSINDCGNGTKRTHLLYQLLHRSENTASRGWTSSSQYLLQLKNANGAGLRDIVSEAALVALTGLHSCIDPPSRCKWRERLRIHHSFRRQFNVSNLIDTSPNFVKQIVRRLLLSTYVGNEAARTVHNSRRRMKGAFAAPPYNLAPRRCRHLMSIITLEASKKDFSEFIHAIDNLIDISSQRSWTGPEEWPWNGKAGTPQPLITLKPIALSMYMQAHMANFAPFWKLCYQQQVRTSRLDKTQYDVFCEMNQMVEITCKQREAVKKAMSMPHGHRVTLEQALALFGQTGLNVTSSNYKQILKEIPLEALSSILAFARASSYFEHMQQYEYPLKILMQQEVAVYERYVGSSVGLDRSSIQDALKTLPEHACKLCICTECHRVTNAYPTLNDKDTGPFNEVGVASCITSADNPSNMRCAKRISAAIRTAIAAEQLASKNAVDMEDEVWERDFDASIDTSITRTERGYLRRDARRTYEQLRESKACGENPLLRIPLLGKLVRVCNSWHTLCCYCGGLIANVSTHANVKGYPACMRCSELKIIKKEKKQTQKASEHICRFCRYHKKDLVSYFSPFDDQFENKNVPQDLRVTFWCSKHRPPWLQEALKSGYNEDSKVLHMSEIVARIGQHMAPRH